VPKVLEGAHRSDGSWFIGSSTRLVGIIVLAVSNGKSGLLVGFDQMDQFIAGIDQLFGMIQPA